MQDKNGMINQLLDLLGAEADRDLAERVYTELRADDRIYYAGDAEGLKLADGVDLIDVSAKLLD